MTSFYLKSHLALLYIHPMRTLILTCTSLALLTACGHESYVSSPPRKETDKYLTCDQVLLEINDATYWNQVAHKNKEMGILDVLWPPGYINTAASADEAIATTNQRIQHLQNIYRIKGCRHPHPNAAVPLPGR